ncbi:gypsy retrotransposon integrase-like protein 1 isoform X2 [Moschus berezovskii]|uniref:gypsy retrotransposon integrase-like protein 1 isoform X2 n=1 Tax=Moschus berezovskii TaxID=68408 RepID=UPI002443FC32|nr:gypsy retrotransposon integrase-like protein 1 isoform X2 [Moschus berezovskii]
MMVRSGKNGDLHLKQIAYYKRTGEYHPTTLPSERSGIRRAAKKFVFKEKKLFYVGKDRKQDRLVVVSEEEKKKVLRQCHENDTGAHHGISRTLTLVESSYYWTSVTNDVKQWVYACPHCQVAKNTVILAPKQHLLKVENPWSIVTVDLMGPFHTSNRSHVYAIIMTDLFTKWVVILPLCDVSASEISKAIINIFFLYGPPQKIIMDQRDEFIHQINVELCELFGTKQIVISHASQTINPTESTPSTIKTFLSKHCADYPYNWDDHLSAVSFAFNVTHSEPTKNTPYFQMFNRNPYMPESSDIREVDGDNTNSLHLLHGSVVADHDYVGMPELPVGAYQASILVEDAAIGVVSSELLTSSKDRELLEYRNAKISPLMEDHNALEKQTFSLLDSSNQVLEYLT